MIQSSRARMFSRAADAIVAPLDRFPAGAGTATGEYVFEGHVDFYGSHDRAAGWFIGGWIAHPWPPGARPEQAVAVFDDLSVADHAHSIFYHRQDVSGRGIGFVFFLRAADRRPRELRQMRIACAGRIQVIRPPPGVPCLTEPELIGQLQAILAGGEGGPRRRQMQALLAGQQAAGPAHGEVDCYSAHIAGGGWLLHGWINAGWSEAAAPARVVLSFEEGDVESECIAVLYPPHDPASAAQGLLLFTRAVPRGDTGGRFCSARFDAGGLRATLLAAPDMRCLPDAEWLSLMRPLLAQAYPVRQRDVLSAVLAWQPWRDEDTLSALGVTVIMEIDEAIRSGPDGLILMGWCLARPAEIRDIRVRCGSHVSSLRLWGEDPACLRVDRPDVLAAFPRHGFDDPRCGFVAFLPHAMTEDGPLHLEVETRQGELGHRRVPAPKLEGIAAMQRLLGSVDVRFTDVQQAFDHVLGPAIEGLNQVRLARRTGLTIVDYGEGPAEPRFSVIVPLHGRIDYAEYQIALFSAHPGCAGIEFIFVLDDPPKRREAEFLFASVYERFLMPFRAVLLDRNVGFAPASNIGLARARGEFVAFINSDIFPGTPDWLELLADRLTTDPTIGVIGPVLLFEDGSVQHRGMAFHRLPEFGDWFFGAHMDKGLQPAELSQGRRVERQISITGACMVMTRALAEAVGGFDETFVIGYFEDSDLCLRLQELGYRCVVAPEVRLIHLECKSQAESGLAWRLNLTLYNAWQHERRWGETIATLQAA